MGELIAGWRPIVEGYLAVRASGDVADEVIGRLEEKLLLLLLRKQEFPQRVGPGLLAERQVGPRGRPARTARRARTPCRP